MIHSFLLIGQSNMGGRGFKEEVEPIPNEHIFVLRNGRWRPMYVPVNCDRVTSGINLAESFAYEYAKEHNVDVGLIPCADGGSTLDMWCVGGLLYSHAIYQCELASRTSTSAGVLWHQGESESSESHYTVYEKKCSHILESLRNQLKLDDVPFLVGGLGDYLKNYVKNPLSSLKTNYVYVNEALQSMAEHLPMTGFVSAEGLTANEDNLHFNAASLREFGLRYYEEFKKLERKDKVFVEKSSQDAAIRSEFELL